MQTDLLAILQENPQLIVKIYMKTEIPQKTPIFYFVSNKSIWIEVNASLKNGIKFHMKKVLYLEESPSTLKLRKLSLLSRFTICWSVCQSVYPYEMSRNIEKGIMELKGVCKNYIYFVFGSLMSDISTIGVYVLGVEDSDL